MTAVAELIQYIKANPDQQDAAALAGQFGVDTSIVKAALAKSAPVGARPKSEPVTKRLSRGLLHAWTAATERPVPFLVVTSLLAILFLVGYTFLPKSVLASIPPGTSQRIWTVVMMGTPLIQLLGVARHARYRLVVAGAAIYLIAILASMGILGGFRTPQFGSTVVAMIAMSTLYLVLGVPFVVIGVYQRVKRERRAYEHMSRQQILERLLEVRQSLAAAQSTQADVALSRKPPWLVAEKYAPALAIAVAFVTSVAMSLLMVSVDPSRTFLRDPDGARKLSSAGFGGTMLVIMLSSTFVYATQFVLGLLNRKFSGMLLTMGGYAIGYVAAALLPLSYVPFGENGRIGWGNYAFGAVLQGAMIFVGYLARTVHEHTVVAEKRRANDPVALAEELVELEWRLVPTTTKVTVMSVDVVGSTAMKKNADPLLTEWTFREYQLWVENVCAKYGGRVRSTAGDGAILGFETADSALAAAEALHREIVGFNADKNRLPTPFALRIGLHSGDVQGDLGDVQFTRVIDVAAHIESSAPVGGVAVSETVVSELGIDRFQRSAVGMDGHEVFLLTSETGTEVLKN